MADSKRERILQRIETVLAATAGVSGRVYRSDPAAATRAQAPCIHLRWRTDQATPQTVPQIERTLSVEIAIVTRGDKPDQLADPIAQSVHALLMADPTLGGACAGLRYVGTDREQDERDEYLVVTLRYAAVVVTQIDDLTAA